MENKELILKEFSEFELYGFIKEIVDSKTVDLMGAPVMHSGDFLECLRIKLKMLFSGRVLE